MLFIRNVIVVGFCSALITTACFGQGGYGSTFAGDIAVPLGSFANSFKTGYGGHVDFFMESESYLRLSILLGFTRWNVDNDDVNAQYASMGGVGTYQLDGGISAFPILFSVKLLSPEAKFRFYGLVEVGVYLYSGKLTGQKTENGVVTQTIYEELSKSVAGANFGVGLLMPINKEVSLDLGGRYHLVKRSTYYTYDLYGNPSAVNTNQYFTVALGVTYSYSTAAGK
jgi:hypothetical protein